MAIRVAAIVAAGGRGVRFGADRPKQFLHLGGRSMLERTVEAFVTHPRVSEVIVAVPVDEVSAVAGAFANPSHRAVRVVAGGPRRQDSVALAFAAVSDEATVILVHDAARPFVSAALIDRTIDAAVAHGAAIAAVAVRDTVKQAGAPHASGARPIKATLPRDEVFLAQTPQGFRRDVFAVALEGSEAIEATDEAMLVERAGMPVHLVEGDVHNIKVTTPEDLAEAVQRIEHIERIERMEGVEPQDARSTRAMRIGTGYDLHRLVPGRPLILAGVRIAFEAGLDGHSDADIVCHAVTDAVLGAAAAGDIGQLFPDTDAEWKDADSIGLLRAAVARVRSAGYRIGNVDITIIAQRPKLLPHVPAMRVNLAAALGVDVTAVSVKGKTNEGVDSIGRAESMACHAVVLLTE